MNYDGFISAVEQIINRLGFTAEYHNHGDYYTAIISDGSEITGYPDKLRLFIKLPNGNNLRK